MAQQFRVRGTHPASGQNVDYLVEAGSPEEATRIARSEGVIVDSSDPVYPSMPGMPYQMPFGSQAQENQQEVDPYGFSICGHDRAIALTALVLGIVGLVAWIIPLLGFPINAASIVLGLRSRDSVNSEKATAGIIMGIIGLGMSILNAFLGAYLAVSTPTPPGS